jgi:GAF domain-containing protein
MNRESYNEAIPAPTNTTRERAISDIFVHLADTLVDDYDVVDLLHSLVAAAVNLLDATAAGLLLRDPRGNLAVVASSSEETRLLEIFQLQNNEGPCLDCVQAGSSVTCTDLGAESDRWPTFVPAALAAGFQSVVAVPLRLRTQTIGGLNMFHSLPETLTPDDRALAQALADVATIGILQQRIAQRSSDLTDQLQHALTSRVTIEQAKGVLAERNETNMGAAFNAMREYSRNNNQKLNDVAIAIVRGDSATSAAVTALLAER